MDLKEYNALKYYKGEKDNPYEGTGNRVAGFFWPYEKAFFEDYRARQGKAPSEKELSAWLDGFLYSYCPGKMAQSPVTSEDERRIGDLFKQRYNSGRW